MRRDGRWLLVVDASVGGVALLASVLSGLICVMVDLLFVAVAVSDGSMLILILFRYSFMFASFAEVYLLSREATIGAAVVVRRVDGFRCVSRPVGATLRCYGRLSSVLMCVRGAIGFVVGIHAR